MQGCAFLGFVDIAPHLWGGQIPPKQMGGVNRRFQPNSRNRKTCILSKLLRRLQPYFAHSDKDHQKPSWVVRARA